MDGCPSSKWVPHLFCRAQTFPAVWATVGEFGGTEVDVEKKHRWWRAGQVELLLCGTATSTDDTKVSEVDTDPSGAALARLGQSRAGHRCKAAGEAPGKD